MSRIPWWLYTLTAVAVILLGPDTPWYNLGVLPVIGYILGRLTYTAYRKRKENT